MKKDYAKKIKDFCKAEAIDLFGVADIAKIKDEILLRGSLLKKLNRAICLGTALAKPILDEIENQPTRLYFHHYRTVNAFLDQAALKLARLIQKEGFLALPIPASQIVDWQKQTAHLSHKKIGLLAGLGWLGRNNLLVNDKLGSQFRLVTVLTDMDIPANKPLKKGCGSCLDCVTVCPAGAINKSAEEFDHQKCFSALKNFQRQHIVEQYICGICVKACPGKQKNLKLS